jgi:hypothetical protein
MKNDVTRRPLHAAINRKITGMQTYSKINASEESSRRPLPSILTIIFRAVLLASSLIFVILFEVRLAHSIVVIRNSNWRDDAGSFLIPAKGATHLRDLLAEVRAQADVALHLPHRALHGPHVVLITVAPVVVQQTRHRVRGSTATVVGVPTYSTITTNN